VDPFVSGWGSVVGCCKYGDKLAGSGTTELVSSFVPNANSDYVLKQR
jgi:hypothetical protein